MTGGRGFHTFATALLDVYQRLSYRPQLGMRHRLGASSGASLAGFSCRQNRCSSDMGPKAPYPREPRDTLPGTISLALWARVVAHCSRRVRGIQWYLPLALLFNLCSLCVLPMFLFVCQLRYSSPMSTFIFFLLPLYLE